MFANYLIGLREGLEASLVVVILLAHLSRTGRRDLHPAVWTGTAAAIAISLAFGALLTYGPRGLTFQAQEFIGGGLSILAVGFVTWMILWMAAAARNLATDLHARTETAVLAGKTGLALIAALAVGREGLETALFLWAATHATSNGSTTLVPLASATAGLLTAAGLGWALNRGILRINLRRFFTWTGAFLVLVAAGVLSYGVHDLQEAAVLPGLHTLAFDLTGVLDPGSLLATVLKGVFNFSPATTVFEATAWVGYVAVVLPLFLRRLRDANRPSTTDPADDNAAADPEGAPA